ncbi:MAG: hypothetical protein ACE3JN_08730 [Ectobacillus sp.]
MLIWNERRRLQQEKRDSRDPGLSVAGEGARPRPRKASACSGKSTIKFNRALYFNMNALKLFKNSVKILLRYF